jgi:hypothetical protein
MTRTLTNALRGSLLLAASCTVLLALACSQNSYRWEGKEPAPPKNPRNAHVIHKESGGMNAVGSMEEAAPATSQSGAYTANVALSQDSEHAFKPGSTLYLIARSLDGNPTPVAAVKVAVDKFPAQVVITDKDSMAGTPLPPKAIVVARLDDDGDLTTQHPGDMVSEPVRATAGEPFTVLLTKAPGK